MSGFISHLLSIQFDVALLFVIIAVVFALFILEPVRLDVTALGLLVTLVVLEPWTGVAAEDAVSGFASEATLAVLAFFIISEGVKQTGMVHYLGNIMRDWTGDSLSLQLFSLTGLAGTLSGLVNNTPIVGVMIPVASDMADRSGRSRSQYMMPLSFAAICGGQLTLFASTSNLIANDLAGQLIGYTFSMFEFTSLGVVVLAVCIAYLLTAGRLLMPDRDTGDDLLHFDVKDYVTEVTVPDGSAFVGEGIDALQDAIEDDIDIVMVQRGEEHFYPPLTHLTLQPDDVVVLRADRKGLMDIIDSSRLHVEPEDDEQGTWLEQDGPSSIFPVTLPPGSSLIDETLSSIKFRTHYEATVLGLKRRGEVIRSRLEELLLEEGDTMLVQAPTEQMEAFQDNDNFIVSGGKERPAYQPRKVPIMLGILAAVIGVVAMGWLRIDVAALGGVALMSAAGVVSPREMYDVVDWEVIVLIAGVLPLGVAMVETGAAQYLAGFIALTSGYLPVLGVAFLFYLMATLLTNLVNDNASAVLLVPIAVELARSIGADPVSFILVVVFAAGNALMTPVGFQTNLMVFGPGGYRFSDFLRVGIPLQLLLAVVATVGISVIWGF